MTARTITDPATLPTVANVNAWLTSQIAWWVHQHPDRQIGSGIDFLCSELHYAYVDIEAAYPVPDDECGSRYWPDISVDYLGRNSRTGEECSELICILPWSTEPTIVQVANGTESGVLPCYVGAGAAW